MSQAVKLLEKYIPAPSKIHPGSLGLERMKTLCDLLDNPQLYYPTIHVGGTSGKGSTSTILASILATKYKVGLHTSPHLVRINERIKTNIKDQKSKIKNTSQISIMDRMNSISDSEFIKLVNEIKPEVEKMEKGEMGLPSFFEIITAMAFLYFKENKVDIAVIEVGMGGRYDATNVVKPQVAVLTNVGLDHTDILGDTVEKISEDKVGIIKPGVQVVTGVKQKSVIRIVESRCSNYELQLSLLNRDFSYALNSVTEKGSVFDYFGNKTIRDLKLNMLGEFQVENAALAIRAVELLNGRKMSLRGAETVATKQSPGSTGLPRSFQSLAMTAKDIRIGLASSFIPGRLEIINRNPLVILDGAHNPDKMRALVQSVKAIFSGKKVTVVVAIKYDKNAREMLEILFPICKKVIFTGYEIKADQGVIRSYNPNKLKSIGRRVDPEIQMEIINNPSQALQKSIKYSQRNDMILVTGSLYLIGEIKRSLPRRPAGKSQISNVK